MLLEKDFKQIEEKGISNEKVNYQLDKFQTGFPPLRLNAAATPERGIRVIGDKDKKELIDYYEKESSSCKVVKFVPASGAASRMFKNLFSFMNENLGKNNQTLEGDEFMKTFFTNLSNFAFYGALEEVIKNGGEKLSDLISGNQYAEVLEYLLTNKGLNYGSLPKGLLIFHDYGNGVVRMPVEEHLVEAANYASGGKDKSNIHFTVSPEHKELFIEAIQENASKFEKEFSVQFDVSYSTQKSSTDTIAVEEDNSPFREDSGEILFRPAGHGALLENLNDIDADIIFIKNIDNVVPDRIKQETYEYKKVIGGVLLEIKEKVKSLLENTGNSDFIENATEFLQNDLEIDFAENNPDKDLLINLLNRPIRVCGMVRNTGEPGGGPFFAVNPDGTYSLQIVESSQMNLEDESQKEIVNNATHFNPVDLVCWVKDYTGGKFDLTKFQDPQTGFISSKSKDGRNLKAMELPGLWNGSMSNWITVFVEVPAITFNPVKTVNDLLRENHQ